MDPRMDRSMESAMDRPTAAAILGVPVDADAAQVRRAYRMWARITHPDAGGNAEHFARLTLARRTMLRPRAVARAAAAPGPTPAPRPPVSAMVRMPGHVAPLVIGALIAIALTTLPLAGASTTIAAFAAGIAAATWAALATRAILRGGADAGHRIVVLVWTWLPIAAADVIVGMALGTGIITVLPVLALPFVAVVASVNAGAGLWRPIGSRFPR